MSDEKSMGQVIQIAEARIRDHLGEMVRGTVEETLNAMLDAEADQLCGAGRYERSEARQDTRAGSYERTLQTSAHSPATSLANSALSRPRGALPVGHGVNRRPTLTPLSACKFGSDSLLMKFKRRFALVSQRNQRDAASPTSVGPGPSRV